VVINILQNSHDDENGCHGYMKMQQKLATANVHFLQVFVELYLSYTTKLMGKKCKKKRPLLPV